MSERSERLGVRARRAGLRRSPLQGDFAAVLAPGGAPGNSLRSLRSLRSATPGESDV